MNIPARGVYELCFLPDEIKNSDSYVRVTFSIDYKSILNPSKSKLESSEDMTIAVSIRYFNKIYSY